MNATYLAKLKFRSRARWQSLAIHFRRAIGQSHEQLNDRSLRVRRARLIIEEKETIQPAGNEGRRLIVFYHRRFSAGPRQRQTSTTRQNLAKRI